MVIRFPVRPPAAKNPPKQLTLFPRAQPSRSLTSREVEHRRRMLHHLRRQGARF
jgi:hypothetical protein